MIEITLVRVRHKGFLYSLMYSEYNSKGVLIIDWTTRRSWQGATPWQQNNETCNPMRRNYLHWRLQFYDGENEHESMNVFMRNETALSSPGRGIWVRIGLSYQRFCYCADLVLTVTKMRPSFFYFFIIPIFKFGVQMHMVLALPCMAFTHPFLSDHYTYIIWETIIPLIFTRCTH